MLDVVGERHNGSLGCPLMKVKFTILGGEVHETDSSEIAFRYAASDALNRALDEAGIVLLEPIMKLEITVPEENLGDFISDLQQRRAIDHAHAGPRPQHGDRGPGPAGQPVRLFQRHARLEPGPGDGSMEPAAYGPAPPEVLAGFM